MVSRRPAGQKALSSPQGLAWRGRREKSSRLGGLGPPPATTTNTRRRRATSHDHKGPKIFLGKG